jgi:hypothetical protein
MRHTSLFVLWALLFLPLLLSWHCCGARAWGLAAHRAVASVASAQSGRVLRCGEWAAALSDTESSAQLQRMVTEPDENRAVVERPRHFNNADDPHRDRGVPTWSEDYARGVVSWALLNQTQLAEEVLQPFCREAAVSAAPPSRERVLAFVREHQDTLLRSLAYACHYTGDSCQPLHATRNYDGQLSGNRGIHSVFESRLVARYEQQLFPRISLRRAHLLSDVFAVTETSVYSGLERVHLILEADDRARALDPGRGDAYYADLFDSLEPLLLARLTRSVQYTVDVWTTALVRAGCCAEERRGADEESSAEDDVDLNDDGNGQPWSASLGALLAYVALACALGLVLGCGVALLVMRLRSTALRSGGRGGYAHDHWKLEQLDIEQQLMDEVNLDEDAVEMQVIHEVDEGGGGA